MSFSIALVSVSLFRGPAGHPFEPGAPGLDSETWGKHSTQMRPNIHPITPATQFSLGNYRIFNDFGAGRGMVQIGTTPDPCGIGETVGWSPIGQANTYNGASGTNITTRNTYQLAEGRVGTVGQRVSETINGGRTVPWFWSVIEFNSSNQSTNLTNFNPPSSNNYQIFPTYSVYVNGYLAGTSTQSTAQQIILLDQSSQQMPNNIQ